MGMFSLLSPFHREASRTGGREVFKMEEENMVRQVTSNSPHTSHHPASLRCTARSRCKDSAQGFGSFFQFCIPLSDHPCTLVCRAHSGKIPAGSKYRTVSRRLKTVGKAPTIVFTFLCTRRCRDDVTPVPASPRKCPSHKIVGTLRKTPPAWKLQRAVQT